MTNSQLTLHALIDADQLDDRVEGADYANHDSATTTPVKAKAKRKLPAPRVGKVIPNVGAQMRGVPSAPVLPANMSTPVMPALAILAPPPVDPEPKAIPAAPILPDAVSAPVRDVLSNWAWSTNSLTVLPDDESEHHPQLSRKPLFYAIGGAVALLAVLSIVAFAHDGGSEKVATRSSEAVATPTKAAPVADPRSDVKPPESAKVEPPRPEPPNVEPPPPVKPELVKKAASVKNPYAAPAKPKADPATAYRLGLQQFVRGDTGGALETLKTSIASSPGFAPSYRGLGLVYEKLGNKALAQKSYKRYLQVAPTASDAGSIRVRVEKLGS